jgi:hypothetical protein
MRLREPRVVTALEAHQCDETLEFRPRREGGEDEQKAEMK